MVSKRNRIIELIEYVRSLGVEVNIKNKARGNKGFFRFTNRQSYRIDISENLDDDNVLPTIIHEFTHYIHYKNDKSLTDLNFIFGKYDSSIQEELINITVEGIPKDWAKTLFTQKNNISSEIKELESQLKTLYYDFKLSSPYKNIEKKIKLPYKYLLKYDRINVFNKIYSITELNEYSDILNSDERLYITLKSKQRQLKRINSRINRLNSYYKKPSELFARFVELYFTNQKLVEQIAPISSHKFKTIINNNIIPEFNELNKILAE